MMQLWNITANVHYNPGLTQSVFCVVEMRNEEEYKRSDSVWAGESLFSLLSDLDLTAGLSAFVPTCESDNESNSMWKDTISSIKSWYIVDISAIVLRNKNWKKQFFPRDFLSIIFNCLSYQE